MMRRSTPGRFDRGQSIVAGAVDFGYNVCMTKNLKITTIGNSAGIILPKELLARLNLDKGDSVSVIDTPDGFNVRVADAEFDRQMTVMREVMHDYRHALRELAK